MQQKNNNYVTILVRPQLEENVGAVARAMMNFGFFRLFLVEPKCRWLSDTTKSVACSAKEILYSAVKVDSVEDAISELEYIYAFSARERSMDIDYVDLSSIEDHANNKKVGIMFGPEDSGLSNNDISLANKVVGIKTSDKSKSLNLSKAVAIACYELSKKNFDYKKKIFERKKEIAKKGELTLFFNFLEKELIKKNFFRTKEKEVTAMLNIKNMFSKCNFTSDEVKTLYGMMKALSK